MIYIIIALVITIIFLFLIILNKKQFSFTINATLNNIDMFENTKSIALAMREVEPVGNSPVMDKYKKIINKAYNNIEKRADRGIIFDFEKVLLENYYLIFKSVSKEKLDLLANLPHKDKETRIVTLAKYVLEINDYEIKNNVLEIINNFTKFTPLSSEEIFLLPVAINYVLFLKLSELADISNNLQKVREFAIKDDKLKKSFINTDSYLYFYKKFNNLTQLDLDKLGVDVNLENVNYSFITTLAKYEKITKKCFDSIKSIKEHLTYNELKQHIWSHKIMSNNEVYANMDETSQIQYIKTVAKLSSFFRVSEKAIVDVVFNLAQRYNVHFGIILFENKVLIKLALSGKELKTRKLKDNELFQRVYVATIILLNIALAGVGSLMFKSLPLVICSFFALFIAFLKVSEGIVNIVASKIVPNRAMPKMNYKQMPKELETLVVVPCFIANENDCDNIINHIKVLEKTTNDINIKYALLVDFPQSKTQQTELDVKMQDLLISSLKHTNINCFIRKKVKNKNSFIPFERKRGAINDLNEYLICKNDYKFSAIAKEVETPKYVVLLDSDNVVSPNMICESINTISHPLNEKYDLLSYSSNYNLNSLKTRFSRRFLQCCGYESYNNYSNFYFNLTKYDIYCGKGIYNLQNYYRKLKDLIPNNRVLSHDILEGSILQTGAMNEKIYEDAPQNFASDVARQKRWQRGDIQLLPFLKSITNKSSFHNNAMKKPLIYNYLIFANAISILQPCILFAVICYFFVQKSLFLLVPISIGLVLLPFLLFVQQISQVSNNIRAKAVFKKLYLQVINWFYNFLTLPFWAVSNIYLFFTTLFNTLFFKHNMLKWKTFSSFQQKNGFIKHFNLFLPTFVVFALLILITKFNIGIAIYFVLEVIFAICLYFTGKPINNCLKINDNMAKELNKVAQKTYSYFENMNKDNELICDNYQQKPFVGKSVATSPTNLGFSVLSHVCAVKLQIIDIKTAVERIKKELFFIMRLKKYQGNLYNWYNIKTLQPLFPFFISSVDSGNFVACMFVVKAFLKENNCKEADIADKLIKGANLNFFLDETKQLYHIAYDTKNRKFEGYYDILASESRLLNYICAVFSKNLTVWNNLDRTCTPLLGNTLLSWSGTMFEYAMPQIFLQDFEGSLLTKSVKNACKIQYKNSCQGYFGISESGYYKFDEKLNYQYKAFGVGELAVRSEKNRCVISPYSAVLSLPYLKKKAYYNLVNMINNGFLGNFGFFEACDFTDGKNFVKSYMSHHQGMILATLTNVLHCNFIKDLFYKSELIQAGTPMLTELPIETRQSKLKKSEEFLYEPKREYEFVDSVQKLADFPKVFTLTNGEYSLLFDDYGNNYAFREVYFNNFRAEYEKNFGGFGYFIDKETEEVFSCAYSPIKSKINQFRVVNTQSSTTFINTAKNVKMSVCVPNFFAGDCRTFTIENTAKTAKTFEFVFYEQILLSTFEENSAHQAFNDMFVSSSFDKKRNAVIFTKASKEKEGDKHCAFVLCGLPNFKVETNQYNALGALKNEENLAFLKDYKIVEASVGDVIYPCCAFKA
ncbi:MAG: glucoamylase family protein, partial [Clostridia bacterium]